MGGRAVWGLRRVLSCCVCARGSRCHWWTGAGPAPGGRKPDARSQPGVLWIDHHPGSSHGRQRWYPDHRRSQGGQRGAGERDSPDPGLGLCCANGLGGCVASFAVGSAELDSVVLVEWMRSWSHILTILRNAPSDARCALQTDCSARPSATAKRVLRRESNGRTPLNLGNLTHSARVCRIVHSRSAHKGRYRLVSNRLPRTGDLRHGFRNRYPAGTTL